MKYKVLVSDPLAQEGIDILQSHSEVKVDVKPKLPPEELVKIIPEYDALVIRSGTKVTADVLRAGKKLKVVGRAGVGVDNVDLKTATECGIIVMNTPGGNTTSTAELTWALLLSMARNITPANISLREGRWDRKKYTGAELFGKTIGIIGLGRIGTVVGKRALAFGMKVLAYDPFTSAEQMKKAGFEAADLDTLFSQSDVITVHTPKNKETTHLLDDQAFAKMKKGVRVINCARGGIIDEEALERALESGKCAGAALDVYEQEPPPEDFPLISREDCLCTPHLGASTMEAQTNVAVDIAKNVLDVLTGGEVRNALNIPSVSPELQAVLGPYLGLAEKLGQFAIQYLGKPLDKLEITYAGPLSSHDTSFLTIAVLKGILTPIMTEEVNYVNAPTLADQRNIDYSETKSPKAGEYTNLIKVKLTSGDTTVEVSGTNFGENDPRIVIVDGYHIDAKPYGNILFFKNQDEPGVIGHICGILGKNNINISDMTLGRMDRKGGYAVTVCNVDQTVPKSVLDELHTYEKCIDIFAIEL